MALLTIMDEIKHTYETQYIPKEDPMYSASFTCIHCGRQYSSKTPGRALSQLRGHIGGCKKRVLLRHIKFQTVIVVLSILPKRRTIASLNAFLENKQRNADNLLGILAYLKQRRELITYATFEIKNSKRFLTELKDGNKSYKSIMCRLEPEEKVSFAAFCENIYAHRHDEYKEEIQT
jgi:hypothetical protein